ncbi:hypothetical protein AWB93_22735 [Mycobacterium bohemicum]|uniref:Uncharacterized protein n=1 Tax=Mycobacterium bohemicum TaxID=56425 RepID=A0A1X1QWP4_MYCBE|nr:hypothetical protein AWB93_22735 [Mycobacterium bohemicum]
MWRRRVGQAPAQVRLIDLYQGEAWQEVRGLSNDARHAGYFVTTLVASAGLGLRDVSTLASPYAATFAGGHPDSVASSAEENRDWWRRLRDLESAQSLTDTCGDRVLLVLSETYARSMEHDLIALANRGGDLLLVGGARDIDGLARLPANRSLRAELGGTTSSVGLRMARRWLRSSTGNHLYTSKDASAWSDWARSVARSENYHRAAATDADIVEWINTLCAAEPDLSATRALRRVRDAGIACEQKRFGRLFHSVVDTR